MNTYAYNQIEVNWDECPTWIRGSLIRYYDDHIPVGHFLTAVLSNDLFGAMARADQRNRANLHNICQFIYNNFPVGTYGTPEKVKAWLKDG